MNRKLVSLLSALLAAMMLTSTVFAGQIKFSNVTFSFGADTTTTFGGLMLMSALDATNDATLSSSPTLTANGTMTGIGKQDLKVVLVASGLPEVTCTNQGGNQAPGQNPPKVMASGEQVIFGFNSTQKNGKSPFDVQTVAPVALDAVEYGCPNLNWSAAITFIYWEKATISVYDLYTDAFLASQDYTCTTTLNSVTCTVDK